ncbi:MAG: undecaprenyl-phosphate glucose phosphotransferase [Phycisphaerales bacterium]|nr:MAG: undecaprenyl-phosphate glucose phosphotransferase [Phycisphaerales bacterium]
MLREQHRFFRSVLILADGCVIIAASILAYVIRFHWMTAEPANPTYIAHGIPVLATLPIMMGAMFWAGLYRARRDQSFMGEARVIIQATVVGVVLTFAFVQLFSKPLFGGHDFSRMQFGIYLALATGMMLTWRFGFRIIVRHIRSRGWNLRHVAIVGTGRLGQVVCHTLRRNTWTGINPTFFISHHDETSRKNCLNLPVRGGLNDLEKILDQHNVSGVFLALPNRMAAETGNLVARLERYPVDVRIVPDMNPKFLPINMAAHDLEGMPILSLRESPLSGWGRISKRLLDIVGSLAALTIFSIPMLIVAILVKRSGPGPVIFRQERMGLNGQCFKIYKFRTMTHVAAERQALRDAGKGTEAWTKDDDPRITPIGAFLRKTSLDELPQLFNVLLGEMSLVGPRPERPELIERFREDWRGYMLRQNVKAGITGWAQVNGLRGNTSLRKRLQYDLFYVRNWSIMFDIRILWMTVFKGFVHPNAQ